MSTTTKSDTALVRSAVDALLDCYVSWREACFALQLAYDRWDCAPSDERKLAHAGYLAALEREAQSAYVYADQTDWVRRICE